MVRSALLTFTQVANIKLMRRLTDLLIALLGLCVIGSCGNTALTMADYPDPCTTLVADLRNGTLSGAPPTISFEQAETYFKACKTGATAEGADINCGGGVFFLNKSFFLYTYRDYIELRRGYEGAFRGNITFESSRKDVNAAFGYPEVQVDVDTDLYLTDYGTLRMEYRFGKLSVIAMHAVPPSAVSLCR